jgi:hypothetical protein
MPDSTLPPFTEAGQPGDWTLTDRYGTETRVRGDFLGMGSSHRPFHKHAFPPYIAVGKGGCSTCRWMEIRVFQGEDDRYLVVQTARSIVPGEEDRSVMGWAEGGPAVVAAVASWGDDGKAYFTFVAKRALETASEYDDAVHAAYRAVLERVVP